jgi:hypothetical protein
MCVCVCVCVYVCVNIHMHLCENYDLFTKKSNALAAMSMSV